MKEKASVVLGFRTWKAQPRCCAAGALRDLQADVHDVLFHPLEQGTCGRGLVLPALVLASNKPYQDVSF